MTIIAAKTVDDSTHMLLMLRNDSESDNDFSLGGLSEMLAQKSETISH